MMDRRGALMMAGTPRDSPIYSLANRTVSAGESINTNCKLMQENMSATILLDYTTTANPTATGTNGNVTKPIAIRDRWTSNADKILAVGKDSRGNPNYSGYFYKSDSANGTSLVANASAPSRKRIALKHNANENSFTVWIRVNEETPIQKTVTGTFVPKPDAVLKLGDSSATTRGLQDGTINLCEVYDKGLSDTEINRFLGV